MVSFKEKFKFLEGGIDFPFYNDVPKLSTGEWLLLLAPVVFMILQFTVLAWKIPYLSLVICAIMLAPALYVCKGNYALFFRKPKLRDFLTIILCLVGYYVYAIVITIFLVNVMGYQVSANGVLRAFQNPTAFLVVSTLLQLFGEEFFKVFMLLIVMHVVYRHSTNRGLAICLGITVSLSVFGIAHSRAYSGKLLQILLMQGLGSIFDFYAYLKTKNVVVSYILHVLIDFIPFTLVMINNMA